MNEDLDKMEALALLAHPYRMPAQRESVIENCTFKNCTASQGDGISLSFEDEDALVIPTGVSEITTLTEGVPVLVAEVRALRAENERLREKLDELAMNAENLLKGGLPHFSRKEFAQTVAYVARTALRSAK